MHVPAWQRAMRCTKEHGSQHAAGHHGMHWTHQTGKRLQLADLREAMWRQRALHSC